MDDTKILLGKILGEIYRLQCANEMSGGRGEGHTYGLLHGFENCIKEEIERIGFMPEKNVEVVADVLERYFTDPGKLENFKGFYDIEGELNSRGVDRPTAMRILTYFAANGQFTDVIAKMDTSGSPSECRKFQLSDWDK